MIVEFKCKCGKIEEEYYPLSSQVPKKRKSICCKKIMKRIIGTPRCRMGGDVPGYEKENEGKLTLGKAIDMKQKWV